MNEEPDWIRWAREIQAIAQTGLNFSDSVQDRERYERVRDIAVEMFANGSDETKSLIRASFAAQTGYATQKVDVRGVVISNFFFQAEDGIRDHCVTGVQTCALPI